MKKKLYRNRDWMYTQYILLEKNLNEIALATSCNPHTVSEWLRKLNIPIRSLSEVQIIIHRKRAERLGIIKKIIYCDHCGKVINKERYLKRNKHNFCNRECKGKWMSDNLKGKNNLKWKEKLRVTCAFCGRPIEKYPYKKKLHSLFFCNNVCHGKWKIKNLQGENNPGWEGGISFEPYATIFNEKFKEKIRWIYENECVVTGMTQQEHIAKYGRKLNVHHWNYNKKETNPFYFVPVCYAINVMAGYNKGQWIDLFNGIAEEKWCELLAKSEEHILFEKKR